MKSFLRNSALGAADQALLSVFNLLIGVAFIHSASKEEYAMYSLLMAGLLLAQSVQNAFVNSPSATLFPAQQSIEEKRTVFAAGLAVQLVLSAAIIIGGEIVALWSYLNGSFFLGSATIQVMTLAATGVLLREYVRGCFYLRHRAASALGSDMLYVLVAGMAIAVFVSLEYFTAAIVLGCIGLAGTVSGCISAVRLGAVPSLLKYSDRRALSGLWSCSKWALPSVIVSWAYANAFLYLVSHVLGSSAVADISASRLLLVPISLLVIGWTSVFRPRASHLFAEGDMSTINRMAKTAVAAFTAIAALYGVVLITSLPLLDKWLLGDKYSGLLPLIFSWIAFFAVTAIRTIGMSAMLASRESFKPLFHYGWLTLLIAVPCVYVACQSGQPYLVVIALTIAETALAAMIWFRGWPRIQLLVPVRGTN